MKTKVSREGRRGGEWDEEREGVGMRSKVNEKANRGQARKKRVIWEMWRGGKDSETRLRVGAGS